MPDFLDWLMAQATAAANAPPVPADTYDYGMPLAQFRQEAAAAARTAAQQAEFDAFNQMANTSGGSPTVVTPEGGAGVGGALEAIGQLSAIASLGYSVYNATPQTLSPIHSMPTYNGQFIDPNAGGSVAGADYGDGSSSNWDQPDYSSAGGSYGSGSGSGSGYGPSPFSSGPGSYYSGSGSGGSSVGGDF